MSDLIPFKKSLKLGESKQSTTKKGDLLEEIVESLCSGYNGAKVERNIFIKGKTGISRQIDVLIEGSYKSFDIRIVVEAKNYNKKVDIEIVEAFRTKLSDVSGNLGVIVCPLGFTEGAIKAAAAGDIQLFQAFDHSLGNTAQFIPFRYIEPYIQSYQIRISHSDSSGGRFEIPSDTSKWLFHINNNHLNKEQLATYAWNNNLIPKVSGEHTADFGVLKISAVETPQKFFYMELKLNIIVMTDYYLKLFPASFMKNIQNGKGNHRVAIDLFSKKEDMIKHGWKYFTTEEDMESAALPHETSPDMRGMKIISEYTLTEPE